MLMFAAYSIVTLFGKVIKNGDIVVEHGKYMNREKWCMVSFINENNNKIYLKMKRKPKNVVVVVRLLPLRKASEQAITFKLLS
ncbi:MULTISPECIES: hypothetical protein [unclassified Paenibacillus]|uniref:hypothetical protein n=1 Tax=unclassified Paenibacillus TaxID=185978 RepID=UPI0038395C9A